MSFNNNVGKTRISLTNNNTGLSDSINGESFKQQFMQYLEVLKEKVAEMEMKAKESLNEKTFYMQKYEE